MPLRLTLPGVITLVCQLLLGTAAAQEAGWPRLALIIDDVGDSLSLGQRAVRLPGPVTYAILPHTPHGPKLAAAATAAGKSVLLHLPLESMDATPPGPGTLTLHMTRQEFEAQLDKNLAAVPQAVGVNNHMGSLLTRHPGHMQWLMEALRARGDLFFVDSRTTEHTVAERVARETGVPVVQRHVFLDHDLDPDAVMAQVMRWIDLGQKRGYAVAIGHPHAVTLSTLESILPGLEAFEVQLVPVSQLVLQPEDEPQQWQALSSPAEKVLKR
jgi:polysaccharide deacetylase 2 family uncharacterized protein YibQ